MSDCHDRTREDRAELVAEGRKVLASAYCQLSTYWQPTPEQGIELACLLDRALDAIEHLDRQPMTGAQVDSEIRRLLGYECAEHDALRRRHGHLPGLAGTPGHRIDLDEPTMKVALGPIGLEVRIE